MLNTIWLIITALAFGGVVEKAGRRRAADRTGHQSGEVRRLAGRLHWSAPCSPPTSSPPTNSSRSFCRGGCSRARSQNRGFAPVVLSRTIGASGTPTSALDPLEQLRRLHGRDLGCPHLQLFALRGFQLREPAAGDRVRVPRPADDARLGDTEASVGDKGTANGDNGVGSVDPVVGAGAEHLRFLLSLPRSDCGAAAEISCLWLSCS